MPKPLNAQLFTVVYILMALVVAAFGLGNLYEAAKDFISDNTDVRRTRRVLLVESVRRCREFSTLGYFAFFVR